MLNESLVQKTMPGILFVLSAPAGAGKTTIASHIRNMFPSIVSPPSYTTRKRRPHEVDGVDYRFVTREQFDALRSNGDFLEEIFIHGNFYATSREAIHTLVSQGKHVLLVIDTMGAKAVQKLMPSVLIFVRPPDVNTLRARLLHRGTETEEEIVLRLKKAQEELFEERNFDFSIVNDTIEQAVLTLACIIISATHAIIKR